MTLTAQITWPGTCIGTLWEYIYTLQVVSFLVFGVSSVRKPPKMHPQSSNAIFGAPIAPHDVIDMKTMPSSGRAHPEVYCVKIWSQSQLTVPELLTIL